MATVSALRRIRAEGLITGAAALAVALALVLLASGPIFADAVSTGALRRSLSDAPTSQTGLVVDGRLWAEDVERADAVVRTELESALRGFDPVVGQTIEVATSFALPVQSRSDRTDLARVSWVEDVENHVTVVSGRWPSASAPDGVVEIVLDAAAARALALELGDSLRLTDRTQDDQTVEVTVVGVVQPDDPLSVFWYGRERLVEPLTVTPDFRTVHLITTRDAVLQFEAGRFDVDWLVVPDLGGIHLGDVDPLRRNVGQLEARIDGELFDPAAEQSAELSVRTRLATVLLGDDRTLTVARAVIFATVLQLGALAAFALVLVASLGVDASRAESMLLRARGAGPGQLTRRAVVDAGLIVVPLMVAAPFLATWVVGWFDAVGPLTTIDLQLDPRPIAAAWWVTVAAALVAVALLTVPVARAAMAAAAEGAGQRSPLVGPAQRSGLDLVVLAATVFAYWQLRVLGDDRAADVRGRFGVDPLVMLAPLFGIVAGSLLVLRILPLLARRAERFVEGSRSAVGALTAWQLARRPHRYTRTALLLTMGVAVGTFAAVYESTWAASQRDQAAHEVAADVRLEPNRRVGGAVTAVQATSLLASVDGVETVMAVVEFPSTLPGGGSDGRVVALEVDSISALNEAADPGVVQAVGALRDRRRDLPGLDLPGSPSDLVLPIAVTEVDAEGAPIASDRDARVPFVGSLVVTLRDGDGLLHAVSAGNLGLDTTERSVRLAETDVGPSALPRPPLRVIDVQLDTVTQGAISRTVAIEIGPIDVIDADGSVATVSLADLPLAAGTEPLGFLASAPSAEVDPGDDGSIRITASSGSSLLAVRVVHTIGHASPADRSVVAGLADEEWATAAGLTVGDVIEIPTDRVDGLRMEVVGLVDVIPGVDPSTTPGVLVDLPSMQWHEHAPGRPTRTISEYWLGTDGSVALTADLFTRPPIGAAAVTILADREAELTANPPALGSLGALGAGFFASVALAVTALVLTAVVSARERASEFAVLDALGFERRHAAHGSCGSRR